VLRSPGLCYKYEMANVTKKAKRGEFQLLGKASKAYPRQPSSGVLETFPNRSPGRAYWITFDCSDFTSLCPVTGQPDFGKIRIRYVADSDCIETKSLKFYLASFRNRPSFNEEIVNKILDDLVRAANPKCMEVEGNFSARGGISVTVTARHPDDEFLFP